MSESISKTVPHGMFDDSVPEDVRYELARLWMREVRSRNFVFPRLIALYLSASSSIGAIAYGSELPGRWYFIIIGAALSAAIVFGKGLFEPELASEEMEASRSMLRDRGYGDYVEQIEHGRD